MGWPGPGNHSPIPAPLIGGAASFAGFWSICRRERPDRPADFLLLEISFAPGFVVNKNACPVFAQNHRLILRLVLLP